MGTWAAGAETMLQLMSANAIVLEAPDIILKGGGSFIRIGPGGITTPEGWVMIKPGAPPAGGPGVALATPELPGPGQSQAPAGPKPVRRLPLLGFGPVFPGALTPGVEVEKLILCDAMCQCKDVRVGMDGKGPNRQNCVAERMRERDRLFPTVNTIKPEVSYDMSQDPPAPIMSNNEPWRASGRPRKGTKRPDIVIVKDPSKPPTQDNIKRVIEMKFPGDKQPDDQMDDYDEIAGKGARAEVMTLDDCNCGEGEREPILVPVPTPQTQQQQQPKTAPAPPPPSPAPGTLTPGQIEALKVIAAILFLLADDGTGAGIADDAAIPPLLARLIHLISS
jgi:type VI secretion system secreted protein VgrG